MLEHEGAALAQPRSVPEPRTFQEGPLIANASRWRAAGIVLLVAAGALTVGWYATGGVIGPYPAIVLGVIGIIALRMATRRVTPSQPTVTWLETNETKPPD